MSEPAIGARTEFRSLRRSFIGGSDARIIMGTDETALIRLWREKRGEIEHEDLSGNLIVQLGVATEALGTLDGRNALSHETGAESGNRDGAQCARYNMKRLMAIIGVAALLQALAA